MIDKVRTFVAIELPGEVRQVLAELRAGLEQQARELGVARELAQTARWVRPEGTHLTLKFLGWVPEVSVGDSPRRAQLGEIEAGVRRACAGVRAFQLGLAGVGAFPSLRRARVLWVGLRGDLPALAEVKDKLEQELSPLGYPTEDRQFHPHLTLARLGCGLPEALSRVLGGGFEVPELVWKVDGLSLMRSELLRGGARYTQLALVKLDETDGKGKVELS
ncbi:MAG: RNA 2',3'-cyclic phosphodiesterase [Actinobacteria bacterium]|nr:RNA 2',3'-cyclic phosphodiesterase [Actinomycetota bacterium]